MSSIATSYSKEFRKNISYFPVWQPGEPVRPGLIGRIQKGVFFSEGSLAALFPDAPISVSRAKGAPSQAFYTKSSISITSGAAGSHPAGPEAKTQLSFTGSGGIVFHAKDMDLHYIEELKPLFQLIVERRDRWPKGTVLVTHVESAQHFRVLISQSKSWEVELNGKAEALGALQIADASISVSRVKGSGYQRAGKGPVSLRLYGFKPLGRRPRLLTVGDEDLGDESFDEISPSDPVLDL